MANQPDREELEARQQKALLRLAVRQVRLVEPRIPFLVIGLWSVAMFAGGLWLASWAFSQGWLAGLISLGVFLLLGTAVSEVLARLIRGLLGISPWLPRVLYRAADGYLLIIDRQTSFPAFVPSETVMYTKGLSHVTVGEVDTWPGWSVGLATRKGEVIWLVASARPEQHAALEIGKNLATMLELPLSSQESWRE
jgi:hypothetical protein